MRVAQRSCPGQMRPRVARELMRVCMRVSSTLRDVLGQT